MQDTGGSVNELIAQSLPPASRIMSPYFPCFAASYFRTPQTMALSLGAAVLAVVALWQRRRGS
mgnify:CR=1 FL=1